MNKKALIGIITVIVIVAGASVLSSGGLKGSFYDGERGDERRREEPPNFNGESEEKPEEDTSGTLTAISAEALPANENITRVELAFLIHKTLDYKAWGIGPYTAGCFNDSKITEYINFYDDYMAEVAICLMASKNIMASYEGGMFKPFGTVNRAEAAKIFQAAFDPEAKAAAPNPNGYYADVKNSDWFYDSVAWLVNSKVADVVSSPTNYFFPAEPLTHARALYWIKNVKKNVPTSKWVK